MANKKIDLLAELTVLPGFLEEVKAILKKALIPTLQDTGFFEVFSSAAAHEFHLEQDYTKRMFASLDGKLSGVPTLTKLSAL